MSTEPTAAPSHRPAETAAAASRHRHPLFLIPVVAFLILAVVFAIGLGKDPRILPSALLGKPVPTFRLPPVEGRTLGLATEDLKGEVSLVNVFASWCLACREEHPLLMALKARGAVTIHGLNYKDRPEDAARWLDSMGDPYTRTGADRNGRVAMDWGVYGVPETFLVDWDGRIVYKQVGPLTLKILDEVILPRVARLREDRGAGALSAR